MSLISSYPLFISYLILSFAVLVFIYLTFSYRNRYYSLKNDTDNHIEHLKQQLERSGIVLAESRKKVKELENKLNYYNNGGLDPGIRTAELSGSSGLYINDVTHQSYQRVYSNKHFESTTATKLQEETKSKQLTTSNDDALPGFTHAANNSISTDFWNTRPAAPEPVARSEEKQAYTPYVNSGCSDRTETHYSSGDSGSSSSDSCSSSNND